MSLAKLEYNIDKDRKKRKMEDDFVCVCVSDDDEEDQTERPDSEKSEISNGGAGGAQESV